MTEQELRAWLATSESPSFTDESFVVAVLRDIYIEEDQVRHWLNEARPELAGETATTLLARGDGEAVRRAAVRHWNLAVQRMHRRVSRYAPIGVYPEPEYAR